MLTDGASPRSLGLMSQTSMLPSIMYISFRSRSCIVIVISARGLGGVGEDVPDWGRYVD